MSQTKNVKSSKGSASPSTGIGAPTKPYGTGTARKNMTPPKAIK